MNPLWLPLSLAAYCAFAVSSAIDKVIVGQKIKNPVVVSFWVSLMGSLAVVVALIGLLPVGPASALRFTLPAPGVLVVALVSGILLQLALLSSYIALTRDEATRVVSVIGATNPIFALIFAFLLLGERLPSVDFIAFIFLIIGAVTISYHRKSPIGPSFGFAILSGAFTAMQTVLAKYVYDHHAFVSSFILISLGGGLYALALAIFSPDVRQAILASLPHKATRRQSRSNPLLWVVVNFIIGGAGVVVLNVALKLGPVSLINAMRGVQYAGIFIVALLLSRSLPKLLNEELSAQTIEQKGLAIAFIMTGIAILAFGAR